MEDCHGRRPHCLICRIGSLEMTASEPESLPSLICRIGSLEKQANPQVQPGYTYLPHRQLRK